MSNKAASKVPGRIYPGDKIGIVAPANFVTGADLAQGISDIENWHNTVVLGNNIYRQYHQLGGTDAERAADLQAMLNDPEIKVIFAATGGYGTVRLIDQLDFTAFLRHPKWLVGYSDFTVMLSHVLQNYNVACIHGSMPVKFKGSTGLTISTLQNLLHGHYPHYVIPSHALNRPGSARGDVVGGNLTLLVNLLGSASDIDTNGRILFIEDRGEKLYHIDRMLQALKRAGKLKGLKGLVAGGFTDMSDNAIPFGKTSEEIILDAVKEYGYPVCFDFPAGHMADNRPLILGVEAQLDCKANETVLTYHLA